jgi:hypothetical protein
MQRLLLRGVAVGAVLFALSGLAGAQQPATDEPAEAAASEDTPASEPLPEEVQAALREALDPEKPDAFSPSTRARARDSASDDPNWHRKDQADGTAAVSVKRPLPTVWESSIGADLSAVPSPRTLSEVSPSSAGQGSAAAWASVKVPGVASVDTRVEPNNDQGKIGTTVSRSLALGSSNSLTLQNNFALTETLGSQPATPASGPPSVWSNDQTLKFNVGSTGTTLAASTSRSNSDSIPHNKLSAEQKLFNDINVTTTLSDVGTATASKSVTAGFKLKW